MKTLRIQSLLLALLAIMSLTTSCKKDKDAIPVLKDSLIGVWQVSTGKAAVNVSGTKFEVDLITTGTIAFQDNGQGEVDFSISFMEETSEVISTLLWSRDGAKIHLMLDGEHTHWDLTVDQVNQKTIRFTDVDEEGDEIDFSLNLTRKH